MANSLRSKIKKLCHDNNISEKMCNELLEKLEGHDRELRAKTLKERERVLPIANIVIKKETLQKVANEMIERIELDIQEIRNQVIDEFAEQMQEKVESFQAEINGIRADLLTLDYFSEFVFEIAEQMKAGE